MNLYIGTLKELFVNGMCVLLLLGIGCSRKANMSQSSTEQIRGTFAKYHSALGSGRGVVFRVPLTERSINGFSVDSFYIRGVSIDFSIRDQGAGPYLEANYYLATPQQADMGDPGDSEKTPDLKGAKRKTDSMLITKQFLPSWIILSGSKGKRRIIVESFEESVSKSKQ